MQEIHALERQVEADKSAVARRLCFEGQSVGGTEGNGNVDIQKVQDIMNT